MNDCVSISYILSSYIILTRTCLQKCGYCSFQRKESPILAPDEIKNQLQHLATEGATEVVFAAGENPQDFPYIQLELARYGFASFAEYVSMAVQEALSRNIIPVLEIGNIDLFTLERFYKSGCCIRASLVAANLNSKDEAHFDAKQKNPAAGKSFVEALHKNEIPYTICFNIGIGETEKERLDYIKEIGQLCTADPFLQDVRLVPFQPSPLCKMSSRPPLGFEAIAKVIEATRSAFPVHHISIPANLCSRYPDLLDKGLNDLGSLPIFSGDVFNPTFEVPNVETIKARLRIKNCHLYERGTLSTPVVVNKPVYYKAVSSSRAMIEKRNSSIISLIDNDHCFVCGTQNPLGLHIPVKQYIKGNTVRFTWTPGPNHQSYAGVVHGGILATLIDESMGYAIMGEDRSRKAVTIEYTLNYKHPTPVGLPLTVIASVTGQRRQVIMSKGTIVAPDGTVLVEATGKFYEILNTNKEVNIPKEEMKNADNQQTC